MPPRLRTLVTTTFTAASATGLVKVSSSVDTGLRSVITRDSVSMTRAANASCA